MTVRIAGFTEDSIVDGNGIRYTIYFQGCNHGCKGCHNPETHSIDGGTEYDISDILSLIDSQHLASGITLSGGDPFLQPEQAVEICKYVHSKGKSIWCYTGYTFEQIINSGDDRYIELLTNTDVLVDGRFDIDKKSLDIAFSGSSNQRLIDVKKSLDMGYVVEWEV